MRELNSTEIKSVTGGFIHILAGAVAAYYGEKLGRAIYTALTE